MSKKYKPFSLGQLICPSCSLISTVCPLQSEDVCDLESNRIAPIGCLTSDADCVRIYVDAAGRDCSVRRKGVLD